MNKNKQSIRLSIGAISIFMIFVILVMCILAILSYLRCNSYYQSTIRQAEFISEYYQSESSLLKRFYQLDLNGLNTNSDVIYQEDTDLYLMEEKINQNQILQLSFNIQNSELQLIGLKTINLEE